MGELLKFLLAQGLGMGLGYGVDRLTHAHPYDQGSDAPPPMQSPEVEPLDLVEIADFMELEEAARWCGCEETDCACV